MPVRNEERHLAESVRHVLSQDYPGELELVLAVGPSADRTEQIARDLAAAEPRLTVVANPGGHIPAALNAAIGAARHAVIARVDGHALLPPGYLRAALPILAETGAADVGGVMAAEGVTTFQRAVAWAMTSKVGVGSAAFHTGGGAGPVDSVYLGVYHREAIEQAGGERPGPRLAVLPLRPLAAGDRPRAPGDGELPVPGPAGRGRAGRARPGGGPGRPGRHGRRGARRLPLADRRVRDPARLPGRDHRGRRRSGPPGAGGRADPGAARPRRHARLLGGRLPHQPAAAAPAVRPRVRHACRATGRGRRTPGCGRERMNHGLRPPGPARGPSRRRI